MNLEKYEKLYPTHTKVMVRLLQASCVLTLVAVALMVWSVLDPRPIPVIAAMMGGQALGTTAFILYLIVLGADLWRSRVFEERERDE